MNTAKNPKFILKLVLPLLAVFFLALPTLAQDDFGLNEAGDIGLGANDPQSIIVNLIKIALSFLSLLTVIIILWGGFKFMVSGGNEENMRAARKTIFGGIVGLIIILSALGIVNWLITTGINITT
jgi:hypothetical protein